MPDLAFLFTGVYSAPEFGSRWHPGNMYIQGTKKFDPAERTMLFRRAEARAVLPVAERHD